MNKHFNEIKGADWLDPGDRNDFARYLWVYSRYIDLREEQFNWDDATFQHLCSSNSISFIKQRNHKKSDNYFWFKEHNSKKHLKALAYHFLSHIRNAIAHGNISYLVQDKITYYIIKDFKPPKRKNGTIKPKDEWEQTMNGRIRPDLLWEMIWILFNTCKNKDWKE